MLEILTIVSYICYVFPQTVMCLLILFMESFTNRNLKNLSSSICQTVVVLVASCRDYYVVAI